MRERAYQQEFLCVRRQVLRHCKFSSLNVLVQYFDVIIVVGRQTHKHLVQHNTYLVDVSAGSDTLLLQHLGGEVSRRPAETLSSELVLVFRFLGQAEVGKSQVALRVNEDVLWLQVSVQNLLLVQELNSKDEFSNEELAQGLVQALELVQVAGQVPVLAQLRHHVHILRCLE